MRPNLSLEHLAMTLAALGTSAIVTACSRAEPAGAHADQPSPASPAASSPPPQSQPDETKAETKKDEPAPGAIATATASAPPARRMLGPSKNPDKGGTGQASCGAGTCTADPKKK